jgi:AcrR family transcriptional regulator
MPAMARPVPAQRFQDLVDAATAVFIGQGYQRTQMADVAAALGVAKGTVYLTVESKQALFDVVLRYADAPRPIAAPATLPLRAPAPGRTLRYVRERLAREPASPTLRHALAREKAASAEELATIIRELFDTMARNRTAIKLVDRCAADYPELAALWFGEGRGALLRDVTRYVERGIRCGAFRRVPEAGVAARVIIETVVFWAVHRHWDPAPQPVDATAAEDTVVQMLVAAATAPGPGRPARRRRHRSRTASSRGDL